MASPTRPDNGKATISQYALGGVVAYLDSEPLDRYQCISQRRAGGESRIFFGPVCAPLSDALEWAKSNASFCFVDSPLGQWHVGTPMPGLNNPMPAEEALPPVIRWSSLRQRLWRAESVIQLREGLSSPPEPQASARLVKTGLVTGVNVSCRDDTWHINFGFAAPTSRIAREMASYLSLIAIQPRDGFSGEPYALLDLSRFTTELMSASGRSYDG